MRTEPGPTDPGMGAVVSASGPSVVAVALAALLGLGLLIDALRRSSATYDEVAYLRVAADWWRTGGQERITRMGSPLTFWKVQQAPVLWPARPRRPGPPDRRPDGPPGDPAAPGPARLRLDLAGRAGADGGLEPPALRPPGDGPGRRALRPQPEPAGARGAGHHGAAPAGVHHGDVLPVLAFLRTGDPRPFVAAAALGGLAFSCKFTTVLVPPILALAWWVDRWLGGERRLVRLTLRVGLGMAGFLAVLVLADLVVTGFALLPLSARTGAHPSLDGRLGPVLGRWITRSSRRRSRRTGSASRPRCATSAAAGRATCSARPGCTAGGTTTSSPWP